MSLRFYAFTIVFISLIALSAMNIWGALSARKTPQMSTEEFNKAVSEYIANHPEEILTSLQKMRMAEQEAQMKEFEVAATQKIKDNKEEIVDFAYPHFKSSDPAAITVVEFFDYECNFCRIGSNDVKKLIQNNKANFIFREYPIMGGSSEKASLFALKVHILDPTLYTKAQEQLWKAQPPYTDETLSSIAESLGITEKLKNQDDKEATALLARTKELGNKLGLGGIPVFIIGNKLVMGAQNYDQLVALISAAEKEQGEGSK